ncbi:hypothetical protein DRO66_00415 [Candidatus Bathyarchaeota archaeon]|nr:MAG: hypothetical protein DRO66_00415 [Candidatus Bathyarchaeota archaeon]
MALPKKRKELKTTILKKTITNGATAILKLESPKKPDYLINNIWIHHKCARLSSINVVRREVAPRKLKQKNEF